MAETIQSFVEKLQNDGLEAGKRQAEQIIAEAREKAEQIIADAKSQADKIVEDAKSEAENYRNKILTELKLSARDIVLKLQDTLIGIVRDILAIGVEEKLNDPDFVGKVLYEIILHYVECDTHSGSCLVINVPEEMREKLVRWAIEKVHNDYDRLKASVDLHGRLKQAGFEYKCDVSDGTVEVTVDSVIECFTEMISPEVRKIVSESVSKSNLKASSE